MTVGELARLFADERAPSLDLHVVELTGWNREMLFDQTGVPWVNPSPNMRNLNQAILYPGIGLLETTNLSVGRGTDTPFEVIGAPWLDAVVFAQRLNALRLAGVRFAPYRFQPESSVFAGQHCEGVQILITNRDELNSIDLGFAIAGVLRNDFGDAWQMEKYRRLLSDENVWQLIADGKDHETIRRAFLRELHAFNKRRTEHLIYASVPLPGSG